MPKSRSSAIALLHLQYAVASAEQGSFRKAAEVLLVRQSTLSRCIRQLEHSVGLVIFERYSGGVRATEAGRIFLRLSRSIVEQVDALVTTSHMAGRGESGRLAIGFYTSLSAGNLRATLADYAHRFPKITLAMSEISRLRLKTALCNGAIDIAIVTGDVPFPFGKSMVLWSERVLAVLPETHRLATNEKISWTDLKEEILLLSDRDPGQEIQDLLLARLVSSANRPTIIRHDVSRESIKSLVGAGFGISLTLEASLGTSFAGVNHREVSDGTGPIRVSYSASWREDNENPALRSFLKLLGERYTTSFA